MTRHLFIDCDGVLADFEKAFFELSGLRPREFEDRHGSKKFWKLITTQDKFFENLDPMPDAHELWEFAAPHNPTILTGCPHGTWAQPQKIRWAWNQFGRHTRIITCLSREKKLFCNPGDVLVDDTLKYQHLWEEAGGIFVPHTSAKDSIAQLKKLEFI